MSEEEFKGKNLVELLDMLEPVPEPNAISMWPQTQGWIWLALAFAGVCGFLFVKWRARYRANAYRRAALRALSEARQDPSEIAEILRRTALAGFCRDKVANLSGDAWLGFLDAQTPHKGFSSEQGRAMLSAAYRSDVKPIEGLEDLARLWIRSHKAGGGRS